jgi:MarR family transcriptional regulator, transcriptional regulator for hemolysin
LTENLRDRFGDAVGDVARLWRLEMNRRLQPYGLSTGQWLALRALARKGDGTVQKELAETIGIEGSTLVGLLDRLSKAGLVERREAPHDRRFKCVHLSAEGSRRIPVLEAVHRNLRREIFAGVSDEEIERCLVVFERIAARAPGAPNKVVDDPIAAAAP